MVNVITEESYHLHPSKLIILIFTHLETCVKSSASKKVIFVITIKYVHIFYLTDEPKMIKMQQIKIDFEMVEKKH